MGCDTFCKDDPHDNKRSPVLDCYGRNFHQSCYEDVSGVK